jgi:uncharacterized protein (TIGR02118 family)
MSWTLELCATGPADSRAQANAWRDRDVLPALLSLPAVAHVDVCSPAPGAQDPFVAEESGPIVFLMAHFFDEQALRSAIASETIDSCLSAAPAGLDLTATALRGVSTPVDDHAAETGACAYRYVVRYHGPADAAAGFAAHYRRTHPPLLTRLPRIRAIRCYEPIDALRAPRIAPADYLVGNEVEFESADDFNAAMASPARVALRADFEALPRVFHRNTHIAMRPTRHHARSWPAEPARAHHQAEL